MKRELTDSKLLDYQEKIEQSGNLLLSIINNVLDMARIESGKLELDESYAMVSDILEKINGVFEMEAKKKDIHYIHEVQIKHQHIMCDITKVQEILVNLISNAVKYTPHGGMVTVRLREIPSNKEGFMGIRTEIMDTGIGMSKDFLPLLFVAFARERNTTMGKIAGTGLGMPIVKKYIDLMGGTIDVESELGKGTKFTVILQFKIADRVYYEQITEKCADVTGEASIRGKRILLAEDNDLNAEIAMTILEDMGLEVERVEDGIKCVARIEQEPSGSFDLILMDIQMPNMDGYEAKAMKHLILQCFMASLFLICYWFSVKNIILIGLLCPSIGLWSYGYILCYQHLLTYVPSAYQYISCYLLHYQDWFQKCVLLHVGFYHQHLFYA